MQSVKQQTVATEASASRTDRVNLLDPCMATDPYAVYRRLLVDAPVCQVDPGGMWAVSRYADVRYALKHPEIFSSVDCHNILQPEWLVSDYVRNYSMVFADPPEHTQQRQLVNKIFTRKAIEQLRPMMRTTAQTLVNRIEEGKTFDFLTDFACPYVDGVLKKLTGIKDQYFELLRHWLHLLEEPPLEADTRYAEQISRLAHTVYQNLSEQVKNYRHCPQANMTSDLIQACTDTHDPQTGDIVEQLIEMTIMAGIQPVPYALSQALIRLAHDTTLLEKLIAQPDFIPRFCDELLRCDSPAHFLPRRTLVPATLSGITLPAGANVVLLIAAANRDPDQFSDPDNFDITRKNVNTHLAFGTGIHICLGIHLAKMEMVIALELLLSRYSGITCPPKKELSWIYSLFTHGVRQLPTRMY